MMGPFSAGGLCARLHDLGLDAMDATPVVGGYARNLRWIVELRGGDRVFAKLGPTPELAQDLRSEYRAYASIGAPFMPRLIAWADTAPSPVLVLEDLSAAYWPPPWRRGDEARVVAALASVASHAPPAWVPRLESRRSVLSGWNRVAEEPEPFLRLGLCSASWLASCLPTLLWSESRAVLEGDALVHMDVRSDNLCLADDTVRLVDWNRVCRGNGHFDMVRWLVNIGRERHRQPPPPSRRDVDLVTIVCGYWASVAGLPRPVSGSSIRPVQYGNLAVALPWAAAALSLPPPDGALSRSGRI